MQNLHGGRAITARGACNYCTPIISHWLSVCQPLFYAEDAPHNHKRRGGGSALTEPPARGLRQSRVAVPTLAASEAVTVAKRDENGGASLVLPFTFSDRVQQFAIRARPLKKKSILKSVCFDMVIS